MAARPSPPDPGGGVKLACAGFGAPRVPIAGATAAAGSSPRAAKSEATRSWSLALVNRKMWARAFDTIAINDVTLKKPSLRQWTRQPFWSAAETRGGDELQRGVTDRRPP